MKVYILFEVNWTSALGEQRSVIDVYAHFKDAEEAREVLQDEHGYTDVDHGTDYEVEERDLK